MTFFNLLGQKMADFFGERTDLDALSSLKSYSSDLLDPDYFADLLAYRLYDEAHKIYENKSSLGFVIEVVPLLGAGDDVQKELSSLIREIGEEGSSVQCLSWADDRIDRFLDLWSKPRLDKGGIFSEISQKKQAFFKNEGASTTPPRIFRFLFSYSEPKRSHESLAIALERLVDKKQKALEVFHRLTGKQAFELGPLQLIELLSGLLNIDNTATVGARRTWNKETWLSKQVGRPGTALEVRPEGLVFQGKEVKKLLKTYEVTDYPDQWSLSRMGELLGDFFNKSYRIPSPYLPPLRYPFPLPA